MSKIKRSIGTFGLTMIGLTSMIGSGWLFGSARASQIAGPAAIFSWIIGMIIILTIAMCYAEVGTMFPESGGMVRFMQYSHGSFAGFFGGWSIWIATVACLPIEAVASVTYMSSWPWKWAQQTTATDGSLTISGIVIACALLITYFLLNYWTVKLFTRVNSLITVFKIAVPFLTVIGIVIASFHPSNLTNATSGGFAPSGVASVFTAVASAGIIFSFSGFQNIFNLGGEVKNPSKTIPKALILSIVCTGFIYVCLQTTYILGMTPDYVAKGWNNINFHSPFANLLLLLNLHWFVLVLYMDAFVSPSGAGIAYSASAARMAYGIQKNGHAPAVIGSVHPKYHIPRSAMWFNLAVSFAFLIIFRGWGSLAEIVSGALVLAFLTGPICAMSLRRIGPELHRPVRLKGLSFIAPFAFIFASFTLYWLRWPLTGHLMLIIFLGLPIYFYYELKKKDSDFRRHLKAGAWLVVFLVFMLLVSSLGSKEFGGKDIIPYGLDMIVLAIGSFFFYLWGVRSAIVTTSYYQGKAVNEQETQIVDNKEINVNSRAVGK